MKSKFNIIGRIVLFCAILATGLQAGVVYAAPYASGITNNGGIITFYLNESGGSVLVTYDGNAATNATFDGISSTATNLPSGAYSFSLDGHSTYAITVMKVGTGTPGLMPNVIQSTNYISGLASATNILFGLGDPRGLAINQNPASPYFGRIYISRGANATPLFALNGDGSVAVNGSNAGVTTWVTSGYPYSSPDRISLAANGDVVVGDWSLPNAGVWLVTPDLVTNQLLLGPVGDTDGTSAGVHGSIVSRPVLLGDLDSGATLLTVDSDLISTAPNSLLIYSNITSSSLSSGLGWQNPPDLVGPEVAINYPSYPTHNVYLYPSLFVGPNGYIYSGEYRGGPSAGSTDPAGVQVYDSNYNLLWQSRYNDGGSDYFYTAATGGSKCLPTDLAVSPDGTELATVGIDNHLTVCQLTNGIPDVSTIYTIAPDTFGAQTSDGADEVAWDAAGNLYILSASKYGVSAYTLGKSTVAVTTGNASGSTGFSIQTLNSAVSVYATNNSTISQPNDYGNPTGGTFSIVRSGGDLSSPLTVNFTYGGTAPGSTYTASATGSITFAAGQTTTNIAIAAVSDGVPRLTTALTLTVSPASDYITGVGSATMNILNTAEDELVLAAGSTTMYNAYSNDYVSVTLTRLGDSNAPAYTVNTFTYGGTGTNGVDYTPATPVTFNPGDLTKTVYLYPLNNGATPTHSATLPYTGNKTIVLGLSGGSSYTAATNTATLNIVDSALPPETVLYADPLTDSNDATNWNITAANDFMGSLPVDTDVEFGFNLMTGNGDPVYGYPMPLPPNGSQYALKMTVNKNGGGYTDSVLGDSPATAVNAYLTNHVFSGNFAVRFNMNIIEGNCTNLEAPSSSYNAEEGPIMGINHNGMETNLFFPDGLQLGAGQTTFPADGIFYWVSDSGGRYDNSWANYAELAGDGSPSTNAGWASLGTASRTSFADQFKTSVFTSYASSQVPPYNSGWTEGGPGLPANGSAALGFSVSSWVDVEIRQYNGVVTYSINKTPIFVYTNATIFTNGFLMLGYEDPYDGGETPDAAVYYSNLRIVSIGAPVINIDKLSVAGGMVTLNVSVTDGGNSLTLQSASNVQGPYTDVTDATVTSLGNGQFQVTAPVNSSVPAQFYRILQQ